MVTGYGKEVGDFPKELPGCGLAGSGYKGGLRVFRGGWAMNDERLKILRAVLQRVIPADEFAGACEAGVDAFVVGLLERELKPTASKIEAGLDGVAAEARIRGAMGFAELSVGKQDEILKWVEKGEVKAAWGTDAAAWFGELVTLAMEGFYSDPGNGGNKGEVSWKMIGYDPGKARHG